MPLREYRGLAYTLLRTGFERLKQLGILALGDTSCIQPVGEPRVTTLAAIEVWAPKDRASSAHAPAAPYIFIGAAYLIMRNE